MYCTFVYVSSKHCLYTHPANKTIGEKVENDRKLLQNNYLDFFYTGCWNLCRFGGFVKINNDNSVEATINNKAISVILVTLNFVLLMSYLSYGFITEDEGIRNGYIAVVYIFATSLICCIYYRQNYMTFLFWITVILAIIFLIATGFYTYFIGLSQADWK